MLWPVCTGLILIGTYSAIQVSPMTVVMNSCCGFLLYAWTEMLQAVSARMTWPLGPIFTFPLSPLRVCVFGARGASVQSGSSPKTFFMKTTNNREKRLWHKLLESSPLKIFLTGWFKLAPQMCNSSQVNYDQLHLWTLFNILKTFLFQTAFEGGREFDSWGHWEDLLDFLSDFLHAWWSYILSAVFGRYDFKCYFYVWFIMYFKLCYKLPWESDFQPSERQYRSHLNKYVFSGLYNDSLDHCL